jgi:hypothetical protein
VGYASKMTGYKKRQISLVGHFDWLACNEGYSRARIFQIMGLLFLFKDLQEEILSKQAGQGARHLVVKDALRHSVKAQDRKEHRKTNNLLR